MANPSEDFTPFTSNQTFIGPALEIADLKVLNTGHAIITAWQLTPEEISFVQKTGLIYIAVLGQGLAPMAVGVNVVELTELKAEV
jgi:hypothetical protein